MKFIILAVLIVAAAASNRIRYDNYQVFRVTPTEQKHLDALKDMEGTGYSFWTDIAGLNKPVDILVAPHLLANFEDLVELLNLQTEVYIEDVQTLIDRQMPQETNATSRQITWTKYHTIDEINQWLQSLAQTYPQNVKVIVGGQTYEKRNIIGVHVSFSASNANKAIFIEGGIHAREWIAPATVTYFLNELLTSKDATIRAIAERHDWYIFPVFNVDGYVYTFSRDRLWRKTRVPYGTCYGADPNRNWNYHWNEVGASNNPCAETYAGPRAFSEPCTNSLSKYISTISSKLVGYIAFHSYSQLLLIPYGHSSAHVENYNELYSVGLKAATALAKRYGTRYTVGNIVEVIYAAAGGSMDWVKGNYKTRLTYTYELRDTGRHGFLLPPEQILPNSLEVLDSLVTIFNEFK